MNLNNAEFIKSAASPDGFLHDARAKIVFAGKSNVGKSSVLNRLLNRKNLARVGAQPGKTIHVNYFLIDKSVYFVDLPGYGYAKVSQSERERWAALMESYFARKEMISLGVLILDARHKPTSDDATMYAWFRDSGCPFVIVANKTDKVKKSELPDCLALIRSTLAVPEQTEIVPFSAETGVGREQLLKVVLAHCKGSEN